MHWLLYIHSKQYALVNVQRRVTTEFIARDPAPSAINPVVTRLAVH